jgi:type II secretory pathway component GspD/PulD (secretin)
VVVRDGETIILGGLISSTEISTEDGVPVFKDIPIMGTFFKTEGSEIKRRELILVISTRIVNAEGSYDDFNEAFKTRFFAAADYIDEQLDNENVKYWNKKHEIK